MFLAYVLRRIAQGALVLVVVSVFGFVFAAFAPGDAADEIRLMPQMSSQTVQAVRDKYALNQPLFERYAAWMRGVLRGDFGVSVRYGVPVSTLVGPRARNTLLLGATATVLAWLVGIPLALLSALRRGRFVDHAAMTVTSLPLASTDLMVGLGALWIAAHSGLFPVGGMTSIDFSTMSAAGRWRDLAWHMLLPVAALTTIVMPPLFRQSRAAFIDALESPHVEAARLHGLGPWRIARAYVMPLAANAHISTLGLSIASLLSASLVIEILAGWPGLGPLLLEATLGRDHLVVMAIVAASAVVVWLGTLASDLLLYATDPRIREVAL